MLKERERLTMWTSWMAGILLAAAPGVAVLEMSCDGNAEAQEKPAREAAENGAGQDDAAKKAAEVDRAFEVLGREFELAEKAWFADVDKRRKAGEKIDDEKSPHPAAEFYPRFLALKEQGCGRAALWMALEMQAAHKSPDAKTIQDERLELLAEVVAHDADAVWIREFTRSLTALYVVLPEERLNALVDEFVQKSAHKEAVAEALYRAASQAQRSKLEGSKERAEALKKRLIADYAATDFGKKANPERPSGGAPVGLSIGRTAPDFTTKDSEGVEFKLSDYRGKVVVLDFWGFW